MDAAYSQFALCGPSRTSFLTSRRPDHIGVWTNKKDLNWRKNPHLKNVYSMPQYFKVLSIYLKKTAVVFFQNPQDQLFLGTWLQNNIHRQNISSDGPQNGK